MPKLNGRVPTYRLHKVSGQAIVTLDGQDHYLGPYGDPTSKAKYDHLIADWLANGRRPRMPVAEDRSVTVNDLITLFWEHAETYYCKSDGSPTSEIDTLRQALKPIIRLYGETPAAEFGPLALKAVRQQMIENTWCRSHINKQVSRLKTMFRWAVEQELVPGSVHHALLAVKGLKRGRCEAPESEPVKPVPDADVVAIKPYLSRPVWALIQLQLFTGARPGEVVNMRPIDLDTTGEIWRCELREHKTAHHGHQRVIYLGPQAQKVIKEFLAGRPVEAHLFSPREAEAERRAAQYAARKTPLWLGNRPGTHRQVKPRRCPGDRYDVDSYRRAIARGCDQAFPPPAPLAKLSGETRGTWMTRLTPEQQTELKKWQAEHRWHPHQLRHNAATRIRKERGLDAARALLGHRSLAITDVYAELDMGLAMDTVRKLG